MRAGAPRLILASGSPRRRHLLAAAGFSFRVVQPQIEEVALDALTLREITSWNALRKGLAVARAHPEAVVLAADTLVALGREILGKPADLAEARKMLARLSGRTHSVATGVFLGHLGSGHCETFVVVSEVVFKRWSARQRKNYLATIGPLDKAGAYAAQGRGSAIIAKIIGSRSNVIGLPMESVRPRLARFGVRPNA